jgi:hypothetical protein
MGDSVSGLGILLLVLFCSGYVRSLFDLPKILDNPDRTMRRIGIAAYSASVLIPVTLLTLAWVTA